MISKGYAVIGSGYGDEGKGQMTDYLVRKYTVGTDVPVTVRCNGGSQAGHTVIDAVTTQRHVFGHVGAGTFAGSTTFLSSKFIVNPFALQAERMQLEKMGAMTEIEVHPHCQVTTTFDVILNQLAELARGKNRHGSCAMGINETVTRALAGYGITVEDLFDEDLLLSKMTKIMDEWWEPRLKAIDAGDFKLEAANILRAWDLKKEFANLNSALYLFDRVVYRPSEMAGLTEVSIFEGAQGLEIDEFLGVFPHVTRSVTGLPASVMAAYETGVSEITPVYVSRVYKTRHGAGPLPREGQPFTSLDIVDKTNVHGKWQGEFRYAPLDIDRLAEMINADYKRAKVMADMMHIKLNVPELAITWMDCLLEKDIIVIIDGLNYSVSHDQLIDLLKKKLNLKYASYGESAIYVREVK